MQRQLEQNTLDSLIFTRDFDNIDPNDLAIAYMIALEGGIPDSLHFQKRAEETLAANLMEIKQPVIERLYADLVTQPILPVLDPKSPMRVALRVWGQKGEVYQRWAKLQKTNGQPTIGDVPPSRNRGEWAKMPSEFWTSEDIAKLRVTRATTSEEIAEQEIYKQRYRAFHNLPAWADTEFDPYLDFKIRLCLSTKFRDAGPMGTFFGLAAILRGGTPEDVMASIDLGGFADAGAMAVAGRGQASDSLNSAISYSERQSPVDRRGIRYTPAPPVPLTPNLMKRQQFADERSQYGTGVLYRHTFNKGGVPDIFTNQRLKASNANLVRGGQSAVRAYNGPFVPPYAKGTIGIEFRSGIRPTNNNARFMGIVGSEWSLEEGEYLPITIVNVLNEDGTLNPFQGPPKVQPNPKLVIPPANWQPAAKPFFTGSNAVNPNLAAAKPTTPPRPAASPAPAPRKLTMREMTVANALTREWQSVSGIYLLTGIEDADARTILDMLVTEGFAEKQADPQRSGWSLYRATPPWAAFLQK